MIKYYLMLVIPLAVLVEWNLSLSERVDCLKVIDGDTAIISRNGQVESMRLEYIDAPELDQLEWKGKDPIGKWAKSKLAQFCQTSWVVEQFKRDIYGRLLGAPIYQGKEVGILMLQSGYAIIYERAVFKTRLLKDQYLAAFKEGKGQRRGIWQTKGMKSPYKFRLSKRQKAMPRGKSSKKIKKDFHEFQRAGAFLRVPGIF